jgi:hypothetical protein
MRLNRRTGVTRWRECPLRLRGGHFSWDHPTASNPLATTLADPITIFLRAAEQNSCFEISSLGLSSGESIFGTDGIFPLALHFVRAFYHGVH